MRKLILLALDFLGIHEVVNRIRFLPKTLKKRAMLKKYGFEALCILKQVFSENNSFFWLEFGTLLGAYRDKSFIGNDYDIDVGVYIENKIADLSQQLHNRGFKKVSEVYFDDNNIIEETYYFKNTHIDILYFYKLNDKIECYLFSPKEGEDWKEVINTIGLCAISFTFTDTGFIPYAFNNELFMIPKDSHMHLSECYGDYTKRVKQWSDDMSPNRKFTDTRCFYRKY